MPLSIHHGLDLPPDRTAGGRRGRPSNPPGTGTPPPTIETEVPHPIVTDRIAHAAAEVSLTKVQGKRAWKWGKQRIEGKIQYTFKQGTNDIWLVIELCKGECDSLLTLIVNGGTIAASGNTITSAALSAWWYPGTPSGQVDSHLAAVDGTWNEAFAGTCYVVVHLSLLDSAWPQMPRMTWEQKCYKPIDPRTDARAYSENPFVQWYDWQLDAEGRKAPAARILKQSWKDAADIADQAVGGRKRYESHMSLDDGIDLDDVDKAFRLMTDSYLFRENGQLKVVCDRPGSSVATYGDSNLSTAYNPRMSREDGLEKPNRVWIEFTDITNDWKSKLVKAETAAVTAGTEDEIPVTYKMPWIHDEGLALSRATFILNSYLYDAKLVVPWNETASDRLLGDIVTQGILARGLSYIGRLVSKTKHTDKSIYDAVLLEYNAGRYLDDTSSSPAKTPSTLPDPTAPPPDVGTMWAAQRMAAAYLEWLPVSGKLIDSYEVRKGDTSATWATAARLGTSKTSFLVDDSAGVGTWRYFVKAIGLNGRYSVTAATVDITIFFYGPDSTTAESTLHAEGTIADYGSWAHGDVAHHESFTTTGVLYIAEGISIRKTLTHMFCRGVDSGSPLGPGSSPTIADAEITASGYSSIQQWEDSLDAPRRNGAGIWAPLWTGTATQFVTGLSRMSLNITGDGFGWRNCNVKMRAPSVMTVGQDLATNQSAAFLSGRIFSDLFTTIDFHGHMPVHVGANGIIMNVQAEGFTNAPCQQTILTGPQPTYVMYKLSQTYPKVLPSTDVVTDSNGLAVTTWPTAMAAGQVPHLSVEVVSGNAPISYIVTALSNTGGTVKAFNSATGAVAGGVTLRISAEDRGGGGTLVITQPP